jgi:hypothetical protein
MAYPLFGCDLNCKPQSVGHPAGLWWCSRTMANCTHRSEANFGEPAGVFSAEAGTLTAPARMTAIAVEKIRIESFICQWAWSPGV